MKYALIDPLGRLQQVEASPFPVHEEGGWKWVECTDDIDTRSHDFVDGKFLLKPPVNPVKTVDRLEKLISVLKRRNLIVEDDLK